MINFEVRVLRRQVGLYRLAENKDTVQYRTKDVHVDGSRTDNSYLTWSDWKDAPIVIEESME